MILIRIRSHSGTRRLQVEPTWTIGMVVQKLKPELSINGLSNQPNWSRPFPPEFTIAQCGLLHGDLLYALEENVSTKESVQQPVKTHNQITENISQLDAQLEADSGLVERSRDPAFCKHGANAMCDYCMPLEPYDQKYLDSRKIKHLSYHAYLKKIFHRNKGNIRLEEPSFKVLEPCPSKHEPYPKAMCAKCQPSAQVLNPQIFRMVDHIEFEDPQMVDNFISFWRQTGLQRCGLLYGKYERYVDIPLGIKAVVSAIYEPPQVPASDGVELLSYDEQKISSYVSLLGLELVGMIYTDLVDDGSGTGKVLCKRHGSSFFLSSSECVFIAQKQREHPYYTSKSVTNVFGSRFVTVVVTGDQKGDIHLSSYQVSNVAMSMVRDEIIDGTTDPQLIRVREATATKYIPDVFYKYKNEYGVEVQEKANPDFPVDYLIVSLTEGFPQSLAPFYSCKQEFPIENRGGLGIQDLQALRNFCQICRTKYEMFANFHVLLYLICNDLFSKNDLKQLIVFLKEGTSGEFDVKLSQLESWKSLERKLNSIAPTDSATFSTWACKHCTFINSSSGDCAMCGLPKE